VSGRRKGMALLFVLWLVTALSALAVPLVRSSGEEARLVRAAVDSVRREAAIDAVILLAAAAVVDGRLAPGGTERFTFDGITLEVTLTGESGRVDLSAASAETLDLWLAAHAIDGERRARLRDTLLDRRDRDRLRRQAGAEAGDDRRPGRPGPADRGFLHPFELAAVPGFEPPLLFALLPEATVFTGRPEVEAALAPPALRERLDVPPGSAHTGEGSGHGQAAGTAGGGDDAVRVADPAAIYRFDIRIPGAEPTARVIAVLHIPPVRPVDPVLLDRLSWVDPPEPSS